MLDLWRSEEELKRLDYECGVMSAWLCGQGEQLRLASHTVQGIHLIVLP